MTTVYKFKAVYTKFGIGTAPASAPVCTVVDTSNNILVNAQPVTTLSNMAGVYLYSYSGADGLDLIGLFHTTDTTVDQQDLYSYTPAITANVAVTAANAATLAAGNVAFLSYAHNSMVITSTSTEDLSSATKVWFALKDSYLETDAQSLLFIEKTAGLTHVGKAVIVSPIVAGDGSLTVGGSSGAWTFTVVLKSEAAALLADYAGSGKLGEVKATIGGLDKVIGTVTGAVNQAVIRTNA